MQTDRRGQAQSILTAEKARNVALQNVERNLIELLPLFTEMNNIVIQQEAAVMNIEQQGEQVEENVAKANVEIDGAIVSAKAARRKKFWCLGIISKSIVYNRKGCPAHFYSSHPHHHRCCRRCCRCGATKVEFSVGTLHWRVDVYSGIILHLHLRPPLRHLQPFSKRLERSVIGDLILPDLDMVLDYLCVS